MDWPADPSGLRRSLSAISAGRLRVGFDPLDRGLAADRIAGLVPPVLRLHRLDVLGVPGWRFGGRMRAVVERPAFAPSR